MTPESESHRRVQEYLSETLAATIAELSSPDGRPSITFRRRYQKATFFINPSTRALEAAETTSQITYTWPGKDAHEAWKYTVSMRVLAAIAEAVHSGITVSKRDIYYSDPACFGTQKVVDAIVDDFAHTIGVDRAALNVDAAAKGLVAGCYRPITMPPHDALDGGRSLDQESLIPRMQDTEEFDVSNAEWILIIEKEAVFRRLTGSIFHIQSAAGKGILITGKGYPDLNTRAFVRAMSDSLIRLPKPPRIYILVDSDPDGMAIMSTYKYGSMAHAGENARLNIPCIRWLGLRTSDVVADADPLGDDALGSLTPRDRKKAISMLSNNPVWADDGPELGWRAELQVMLMLNLKAEIETLYNREGGIERWIDQQMARL